MRASYLLGKYFLMITIEAIIRPKVKILIFITFCPNFHYYRAGKKRVIRILFLSIDLRIFEMQTIPIGVPVCLKSHMGNNLQNEFFWRNARCNNRNTEAWEQMIFEETEDGYIAIKSRWNDRYLQVQPDGRCVFANHNRLLWEKFVVEEDDMGNY